MTLISRTGLIDLVYYKLLCEFNFYEKNIFFCELIIYKYEYCRKSLW